MPAIAQEKELLLLHGDIYALDQALKAYPTSSRERDSLIVLVDKLGGSNAPNDAYARFTSDQADFISTLLVPWALNNLPDQGGSGRNAAAQQHLDHIAKRLQ